MAVRQTAATITKDVATSEKMQIDEDNTLDDDIIQQDDGDIPHGLLIHEDNDLIVDIDNINIQQYCEIMNN